MEFTTKFLTLLILTLVSTLLIFTACEKDEDDNPATDTPTNEGTVTDIDGNVYSTVQIGDQEWMAENLKTTTYNDGTPITHKENGASWTYLTTEAYCWYDNYENTYGDIYGALYNWYAVNTGNLCPDGWHAPIDEEWTALKAYIASDGHEENEGTALKATSGWSSDGNGTNDYGFTALPGGYRDNDGVFNGLGHASIWWSATVRNNSYAGTLHMYYYGSHVYHNSLNKGIGFSVRCVRD